MLTHSTLSALSEYSTSAVLSELDWNAGGSGAGASLSPLFQTNLPKNLSQTGDTDSQPTTNWRTIAKTAPKPKSLQPCLGGGVEGGGVGKTPID